MRLITNTYYYKSPIVAWTSYFKNGQLLGRLNKEYKPG